MLLRIFLIAALALVCGPASAALFGPKTPSAPKTPAAPKAQPAPMAPAGAKASPASRARPASPRTPTPPMQFYVVKGAPDACGRGCDRWIQLEGQIDSGAAARFRKFFAGLRDRNMPLYFYSPGGNLDQAMAMGVLLHERPAIARVGRTILADCGFEAQDGEVCLKLKQSGRELHGELTTRGVLCGSACPYLMLGASTREIAPDAALAVHNSRIVVTFTGGTPTPTMIAAANARAHERSDRNIAAYFARVRGDSALLALARTVKFEDMHVLTREEIVRFGIDRREFADTPWIFEPGVQGMVRKIAVQRREGEASFHMIQWRVVCFNGDRFELDFQRPIVANAALAAVSLANGGAKPLGFAFPPRRGSGVEQWGVRLDKASLQPLLDLPQAEFTETSLTSDGRQLPHKQRISGDGLARALDDLIGTCPVAKTQTVGANEQGPRSLGN
jgi:hypothetical protein